MKSSVSNYINYQDIPVPQDLLTIEIPSWEAVAQPIVDYAEDQYAKLTGQDRTPLDDDKVLELNLSGISSLSDLKKYGMETYQKNQEYYQYFEKVLPFILSYYQETSNPIIDRQEKIDYLDDYIEQIQTYAQAEDMTLAEYVKEKLKLDFQGDPLKILQQRGLEDFIFKLIAQDIFVKSGRTLNEESYEDFIMQNVLHNQLDEIDLREEMPYHRYLSMIPEIELSQAMMAFFIQQMRVKINPEAPLRLFK